MSYPAPILPESSVLTLEEYLAMQRAIGTPARFRILRTLVHNGHLDVAALEGALDIQPTTLHGHLDALVDVGLVQFRQRNDPDRSGVDSYYRATTLGEGILEHGVVEVIRREREFLEAYG